MLCPECKSDLIGDPIPEHSRDLFGGAAFFERQIGIYDRNLDAVVAFRCPDCGAEWPRNKELPCQPK